jgi:hypothetical protein
MAEHADTTDARDRPGQPPRRPARPWQDVITVEPAGYVEMTDSQRRAAVAVFTDILANWWRRHDSTSDHPGPASEPAIQPAIEPDAAEPDR